MSSRSSRPSIAGLVSNVTGQRPALRSRPSHDRGPRHGCAATARGRACDRAFVRRALGPFRPSLVIAGEMTSRRPFSALSRVVGEPGAGSLSTSGCSDRRRAAQTCSSTPSSPPASRSCSACPGVHNLALWRSLARSPIRLVTVRHEQAAAYAADGYARPRVVAESH